MVDGRNGDTPDYPHPAGGDRPIILDTLKRGRDRLAESLSRLTPEHLDQLTPLPFAVIPTPVALQIAVLEGGYHRWDLEHALGNQSYELPDDIAPHGFEFLGGLLPMLSAGGVAPPAPLAFELRSPHRWLVLEHAGESWQPVGTTSVDAVCVVGGDIGILALFGMGRISAGDPAIAIDGTAATEAGSFKSDSPVPERPPRCWVPVAQ